MVILWTEKILLDLQIEGVFWDDFGWASGFLLVSLFFLASSLSNLKAFVEEYQPIPVRAFR